MWMKMKKEMSASPVLLDGNFQLGRYLYVVNDKQELRSNSLPKDFGNEIWSHPYLRSDDQQVKIETNSHSSIAQTYRAYLAIYDVLSRSLEKNCYIWPYSDQHGLKSYQLFAFSFSNQSLKALGSSHHEGDQKIYKELIKKLTLYHPFLTSIYGSFFDNSFSVNQDNFEFIDQDLELVVAYPVNPHEVEGSSSQMLYILHLLIIYLAAEDTEIIKENLQNLLENPVKQSKIILEQLSEMAQSMKAVDDYGAALKQAQVMLENNQESLLLEDPMRLAKSYQEEKLERPWIIKGFENMESSTQNLFFDAVYKGIKIEILDEMDHLLRLSVGDHIEYVQQANRSNKVSYINSIIMENKHVTKLLLDEKGYQVPQGEIYLDSQKAKSEFWRFQDRAFVVKPKSTNAGKGITVFKQVTTQESYEEAVDIAFSEDSSILVEEFATGIEYRFHILGGECKDVLLRTPAHVRGDGRHTISELVAIKNRHPFRGEEGRTPLVNIKIGRIEHLVLKEQGYLPDSIPEEGHVVYLRENSNISTGGDSKIVGEDCHASYIQIAEEIAEVIDAPICGVDMMIDDLTQASTEENPGYHVIETNANPGMYGHLFVSEGEGSRLTLALLDELFPELAINFQPRL